MKKCLYFVIPVKISFNTDKVYTNIPIITIAIFLIACERFLKTDEALIALGYRCLYHDLYNDFVVSILARQDHILSS